MNSITKQLPRLLAPLPWIGKQGRCEHGMYLAVPPFGAVYINTGFSKTTQINMWFSFAVSLKLHIPKPHFFEIASQGGFFFFFLKMLPSHICVNKKNNNLFWKHWCHASKPLTNPETSVAVTWQWKSLRQQSHWAAYMLSQTVVHIKQQHKWFANLHV